MIELSRLGGRKFVLNSDQIKTVESAPDTIITLSTGEKLMVEQSLEEVVRRATDYWKRIHQEPLESRAGSQTSGSMESQTQMPSRAKDG